jgi:hypothetical protein
MSEPKGTDLAPEGKTWVCCACGKTSRSRYGFDAQNKSVAMHGWDESCMLHAALADDRQLVRNPSGRVTKIMHPVDAGVHLDAVPTGSVAEGRDAK